jgi:tetratricopeptide (TPR) repeat protein
MSGSEPKNHDPLTQAGRITAEYDAVWRQRMAASDAALLAKPPRSRIRQAREQAAIGMRLFLDGKHLPALERFRRSTELDPTVATVQLDLGLVCFAVDLLDEAVNTLRRPIGLDPDLAVAHLNLANLFEGLGQLDAPQAAYVVVSGWLHRRRGRMHALPRSISRVLVPRRLRLHSEPRPQPHRRR